MIKRLGLAVFLLACVAAPARANGPIGFGFNASFGGYFSFSPCFGAPPSCNPCYSGCGGPTQLAPWYQYWPMDAHFQTPAPITYPFWPAPQTPPYGAGHSLQPASYQFSPPPYWYGR